jgi:hypothetical protein
VNQTSHASRLSRKRGPIKSDDNRIKATIASAASPQKDSIKSRCEASLFIHTMEKILVSSMPAHWSVRQLNMRSNGIDSSTINPCNHLAETVRHESLMTNIELA